jgi:hypothetical protein
LKHILGMVKPYPDVKGRQALQFELDYLRLVYAVGEMKKQGENAQGYFIVIGDGIPNRMAKWEHDYRGKRCVELISTLPTSYLGHTIEKEKSTDLSGMVTAAILGKTARLSDSTVRRNIEDYVIGSTILALEPRVQQIKDESRFPMGIRWDYYGVADS